MLVIIYSVVSEMMFTINEYYFYEKLKCRKFKCRYLNVYKTVKKIHLNDRNRIYLRFTKKDEALIKFIRIARRKK